MYKITTYYQLQEDKINAYRDLSLRYWYDHVIYTRNTILSLLSNGEDANTSLERLLKNQDDIGNLLRPFYPSDQVDQIVALLKDHINQSGAIIAAAMSGNDTTTLVEQWRANCQQIVQTLITLNPAWEQTKLSNLWDEHLTLTLGEVAFRNNKNWTSDIMNFDRIMNNIQEVSNILVDGIVQQFPLKFCKPVMQGE